jgi:ABC-type glycerol-3-phosphate transport system permease component
MKRYKKITRTPGEWVLDIVKVVFLAFVVVVTVYPFWNIFIISINDATDAIRGGLYFLPRKLSLSSYAEILGRSTFLASIKVSVGRTLIGTPIAVLVTFKLQKRSGRKKILEPAVCIYDVFRRRSGSLLHGIERHSHAEYLLGFHFSHDDECLQYDPDPFLY